MQRTALIVVGFVCWFVGLQVQGAPQGHQTNVAVAAARSAHHPTQTLLLQPPALARQDRQEGPLPAQVLRVFSSLFFSWVRLTVVVVVVVVVWDGCRDLNLSPYLAHCVPSPTAGATYDLFAVVNHYGGILAGHYTAFAQCPAADGGLRPPEVGKPPPSTSSSSSSSSSFTRIITLFLSSIYEVWQKLGFICRSAGILP